MIQSKHKFVIVAFLFTILAIAMFREFGSGETAVDQVADSLVGYGVNSKEDVIARIDAALASTQNDSQREWLLRWKELAKDFIPDNYQNMTLRNGDESDRDLLVFLQLAMDSREVFVGSKRFQFAGLAILRSLAFLPGESLVFSKARDAIDPWSASLKNSFPESFKQYEKNGYSAVYEERGWRFRDW